MSEGHEHHHHGTDLKALLTRKAGPLPVWGWLAAIAGGLGVAWYIHNRSGSSSAAGTDTSSTDPTGYADATGAAGWQAGGDTSTDPGAGNVYPGDNWWSSPGPSDTGSSSSGDTSSPEPTPAPPEPDNGGHHVVGHPILAAARRAHTNEGWKAHMIRALQVRGVNAAHATQALDAYTHGHHLSPEHHALVEQALALGGPPPKPQRMHHAPQHVTPHHAPQHHAQHHQPAHDRRDAGHHHRPQPHHPHGKPHHHG